MVEAQTLAAAPAAVTELQPDASGWLAHGRSALLADRPDEALRACHAALAALPDMVALYTLMLGAADRAGDRHAAQAALAHLVRLRPQAWDLQLRFATGLLATGQTDLGILHLHAASRHDAGAVWAYVTALAAAGRYAELLACQPLLDSLAHPPPRPFGPYALLALAKLAAGLDRPGIQRTIASLERSPAWLRPSAVIDHLRAAIAARRPYSFVQIDEAESRFLCYASPRAHLVLRPHEASTMVDASWESWTQEISAAAGATRIALLGRAVLQAIAHADLCGIADGELISLDNYHYGFHAEIQRLVLRRNGRHYTSSRVLPALHAITPFFTALLADQPFLGVVSCQAELAAKLARLARVVETATYPVPEAGSPAAAGYFPGRHQSALDSVHVPFPGAVFLVSAGVLGKLWCARIRQLGGIAIEIGDLASRWMAT